TGHGVAGGKQRACNLWTVSDDHSDGHRFAKGAAQPENYSAEDTRSRVAQQAGGNHLPPSRTQGQDGLSLMVGNGGHPLARDRRDDGDDHDGEDDSSRQHSNAEGSAFKESSPAQIAGEPRFHEEPE